MTVTAKNLISKTDRKVIIPPKSKVEASTSGLDLLQKLSLPGITINQLTGSIRLLSGGELGIYIDGIPATDSQIASLDPENILRIEYHDNQSLKYGNAEAVLDYITRKKEKGGRLFLESMNCIGNGKFATLDEAAAQIHHGKSSWAINAGYAQMMRDNWIRDYEEIWRYPDHEVSRTEKGLPVKVGMSMLHTDINYQFAYDDSNLFNARFSFGFDDTPYKEEGDRHSLLTTSESSDVIEIWEHTAEKSLQPSIAVSYRYIFEKAGIVSFNLEGSWLKSKSNHSYSEKIEELELGDIFSNTNGNQYGFFTEGIHEIKIGAGTLTSGIRHTQSHTSNDYWLDLHNEAETTTITQAESSIFAEYNIRVSQWGFAGGLIGKRLYASQNIFKQTKFAVLPKVSVSYAPNSNCFFLICNSTWTTATSIGINERYRPRNSTWNDKMWEPRCKIILHEHPGLQFFIYQ